MTSYKNIFVIYEDICIPRNISNQMKNEICLNFNEANSFRTYNECIYESNLNFNYISSRIYLIIIIILFVLILAIIYYNKYLIAKKEKPFNAPSILAQTLFPNINDYQSKKSNESVSPNFRGKYYNI